jgi:predicted dehydrogenase
VLEVVGANYASPWACRLPGKDLPAGLDWDAWCGPTEPVPFHEDIFTPRANPGWISFRTWSGGEMTGWGAHGLDQVQWALGMDASGPVEVWTEGGAFEPPTYTESGTREKGEAICSKPTVFYRYASGTVLRLADGPPGGAIFRGEKGTITIDRGRFTASPEVGKVDSPAAKPRRGAGIDEHIADWFDSMKSRKLPAADIELAHRSTTVCHLGNIARWTGRRLQWDPERETFPHDAAADALLDRPRRKGFEMPEVL